MKMSLIVVDVVKRVLLCTIARQSIVNASAADVMDITQGFVEKRRLGTQPDYV